MSTLPSAEMKVEAAPSVRASVAVLPVLATILAVLGTATIAPSVLVLWTMWTNDALKSVGMAIPVVSLVLILRAWKSIGWERQGSWWGLALILTAAAGSWIEGRANLVLVLSPETSRIFPPASLVVLLYGAGVVLLMGGTRLLRLACFSRHADALPGRVVILRLGEVLLGGLRFCRCTRRQRQEQNSARQEDELSSCRAQ